MRWEAHVVRSGQYVRTVVIGERATPFIIQRRAVGLQPWTKIFKLIKLVGLSGTFFFTSSICNVFRQLLPSSEIITF